MTVRRLLGSAASVVLVLICTTSIAAAAVPSQLQPLHRATAKFRNIATAELRGFALFTDADGKACIAEPGMGAMGIHWVNGKRVGDPAIIATKPEALVYAPGPGGRLTLAAVEYVVVKDAWDATHSARPKLFGHRFQFTDAPNRFGLPPFYSRHVWVWKDNPAGRFQMFNPDVHCGKSP